MAVIGLACGAYYFSAPIVEVPFTGRKRRQLIPDEISEWIGTEAAMSIIGENEDSILPDDHPLVRMVASVGNVLTDANNLPRHTYIVIDSDEVNAFVTGSNIVFVYTGILPILENVSGMAMVLGHEMGHVIAGHGADGIASSLVTLGVSLAVQLFGSGSDLVSEAVDLIFARPKQRSAELEADQIGYVLMSRAGFDRREAPNVYTRMMISTGEIDQEAGDDWSDTHPIWPTRIGLLEKCVDEDPSPVRWIRLPAVPPFSRQDNDNDNDDDDDDDDDDDEEVGLFGTMVDSDSQSESVQSIRSRRSDHPWIVAITPAIFHKRARAQHRIKQAKLADSL